MIGREGVWFRHPLLAGVLAESYLPGEAAPVHAAWAAHLEALAAEGVDELRRLGDLASHHERLATSWRRSVRFFLVPISPRSFAGLARPPTCWFGR